MSMRRQINSLCCAGLALVFSACGQSGEVDPFQLAPVLIDTVEPEHGGNSLAPIRLTVHADTLWVCYKSLPLIEAWSLDDPDSIRRVASVGLTDPVSVIPSSLVVGDSNFVVTDHGRGAVVEFDRDGRVRQSFDSLPGGKTGLSPLAVDEFQGVLYVADIAVRRVLAIALREGRGVRESGELILMIPHDEDVPLGFPSAVHVTPDGRLLVGDAKAGVVEVYTCDGRAIYKFDPVPDLSGMAPQGFAQDTVIDPAQQDEHSADPSGIRNQGRIHVADSVNGRVHVYGALGSYLLSYPQDGSLTGPSDVAIHAASRRVFVADPGSGSIVIYRYEDGGV